MTEQINPIAYPYMICPCCEEYWCLVEQLEVARGRYRPWGPITIHEADVYYLLAKCPCGASWAGVFGEGA